MPIKPVHAGDDGELGTSYYAGLSCRQLWYERNSIFASRGQCFKTKRARSVFGKGCFPPYGKLPSNLRNVVKEIRSWERRKGC
ncbi:MAG: YARHG domain-containing protein [Hyphomicrobiaceae bacterium]